MAETQTQESPQSSPDIGSLVGGDKSAISDLVKMQGARTAEDFAITRKADVQLTSDQARVEKAYKAEGVGPDELKPWDANKEHAKFEHDPIEGFGSVGGVFAMVASAFTKTPMDNAILGMAGALNSIKAGDEAAYERAYGSWKDNTKLALDRHKVQHDLYSDALSLMDHNQGAAQAKLHNAAVRFGDSQMLTLAEHGMVKELFELQASRAKSAEMMQGMMDKTTLRDFQRSAIEAIKKNPPQTGDPTQDKMQLAAQVQRVFDGGGRYGSAEQEAVGRYVQANISKEPGAFADGLAEIHQKFSSRNADPKVQAYNEQVEAWQAAHPGETMSDDEQHAILERTGNLGRPGLTSGPSQSSQARKTRAIEEIQKKHADDGKPISLVQAEAEYNRTVATPSGNRVDDLRGKRDQSNNIIEGSKKQLEFLRQYKGGAGLMGKIMRGEEIAANIVGAGTQSDRVAFRRRVNELQEIVPRILTDSTGRPLASAQKKVDDIVAGLKAGDTTANTIRAYEDLIVDIENRKKDYEGRIEGGHNPETKSSGAKPGTEGKKPDADWLNAYPVKGGEKRSDAGGTVMSDANPDPVIPGARYASVVGKSRKAGEPAWTPQGQIGKGYDGTWENPIIIRRTADFSQISPGQYYKTPDGSLHLKINEDDSSTVRKK